MSLFLDQKYLLLISNRLPLFKKKKEQAYNCRCVLCGDSQKNTRKCRGYFFAYKTDMRYKCYNCDVSTNFAGFLKHQDSNLYAQYAMEKYSESHHATPNTITTIKFEEPRFKSSHEKLIDTILMRLDTLPDDNEAVVFCKERKIPIEKFNQLYFIPNIKNIVQFNEGYKESIRGEEPRLVLPFYDGAGNLTGLTCRAILGETLRYITVKVQENTPLIFGLKTIEKNKLVYVVEGPIDSLFVGNSIAVTGTSFSKLTDVGIEQKKLVVVIDNQPRNKEVCKIIEKNIDLGYNVIIWPQTIVEKDINEMVLRGRNIAKILKDNTFNGLMAKAKFYAWRRC
jgi:hypothetical protein